MKREDDVPWTAIAAVAAVAVLLYGCASGPKISVAQPDVTLTPPAALMVAPEPLSPAFWPNATTAPTEDAATGAPKAATAPQAPAATVAAPTSVSPTVAPPPAQPAPVPAQPVAVAPTPLIPPAQVKAPATKETGLAPMPSAPIK